MSWFAVSDGVFCPFEFPGGLSDVIHSHRLTKGVAAACACALVCVAAESAAQ